MIKLSDAIQPLSRSVTQFVHGVAKPFLETGERLAASRCKQLPGATASSPNLLPPATANGVVNGVETGDHGAALVEVPRTRQRQCWCLPTHCNCRG